MTLDLPRAALLFALAGLPHGGLSLSRHATGSPLPGASARRCTLAPGSTRALLRIERDTTLPFAPERVDAGSFTGVRPGPDDSLLAVPGTPMPAARTRLLRVDAATRALLTQSGITDSQPVVFIRAAPYRADCRTIRYTDTLPWVRAGSITFARAILAPRELWVGGTPVLVIPDMWTHPYPRERGVAYGDQSATPSATAEAMYDFFDAQAGPNPLPYGRTDSASNARALAWARANLAAARLDPIRTMVRRAALEGDMSRVTREPSRLRGSYRVTMRAGRDTATWYFRTQDKPSYVWRAVDSARTTEDVVRSPYGAGYQSVGLAAPHADSLPADFPRGGTRGMPLVWLASTDRPFAPGNASQRTLRAELEFKRQAAPTSIWSALDAFVTPLDSITRGMLSRMRAMPTRAEEQPRLPLTLRLDGRGGVTADTTFVRDGQRFRLTLERIDTLSMRRPY